VLVIVSLVKLGECQDFHGTVELMRRSRLLSDFGDDTSRSGFVPSIPLTVSRSLPVTEKITEPTEKAENEPAPTVDTLKKYARIFKMDTENLSDKQKMLLQRIVQRIARLDAGQSDEQGDDIEGRARNRKKSQKKSNSTTESSVTSTKSTKRKTAQKDVTASSNFATFTTTVDLATQPTIPKVGKSKVTQATTLMNASSIDLGNITTTSIVDILSTDNARENFYVRRPTATNVHHKQQQQHHQHQHHKVPIKPQSVKPTKYHFYPHNQHIYLLPECAIQQVCNAVYVRLNYTQPLCACPSRYRDPCSASIDEDDLHTTKLIGDPQKRAVTLAKTCESTTEMRECRTPRDWSLLALQNIRTGKSHYLVICRCPDNYNLEGPMAHDQPTYASVPGIRVFGMMCTKPDNGVVSHGISRPVPPKRNQYFQSQSAYYQRFKKHTPPKSSAQQKTEEQTSSQQATLSSESSSDFTTRGISIVPGQTLESREDELDESYEEIPSSTYDSLSSSYETTTNDVMSTEPIVVSRSKRTLDEEEDEETRSRSRNYDDWPSIPWAEISQQIKDIQWD